MTAATRKPAFGKRRSGTAVRVTILALAGLPLAALAGGSATVQTGGGARGGATNDLTIQWAGKSARINPARQQNAYMIVKGSTSYVVTDRGGRPMVLDMSQMGQMGQGMGGKGNMAPSPGPMEEPPEMEPTGDSETIAGVQGEVYRVSWRDSSGKQQQTTAVLSDDPRAVGLTKAFQRFVNGMGMQDANALNDAVTQRESGLLRFGDSYEVVSLSGNAPGDNRFELPAEPTDMQEMMQQGQ